MENDLDAFLEFFMVCGNCGYYRYAKDMIEYHGIEPSFCDCGNILLPEHRINIPNFIHNYVSKRESSNNTAFIYVLFDGMNYKIGVSKVPEARMKQLSVGCSNGIKLLYKIKVKNPYNVEKLIHAKLKQFNVAREWFSCDYDIIIEAINNICENNEER